MLRNEIKTYVDIIWNRFEMFCGKYFFSPPATNGDLTPVHRIYDTEAQKAGPHGPDCSQIWRKMSRNVIKTYVDIIVNHFQMFGANIFLTPAAYRDPAPLHPDWDTPEFENRPPMAQMVRKFCAKCHETT